MRRMRQLLELDAIRTGAPSPVPSTPSGTLPRGQRQLDINPAGINISLLGSIRLKSYHNTGYPVG